MIWTIKGLKWNQILHYWTSKEGKYYMFDKSLPHLYINKREKNKNYKYHKNTSSNQFPDMLSNSSERRAPLVLPMLSAKTNIICKLNPKTNFSLTHPISQLLIFVRNKWYLENRPYYFFLKVFLQMLLLAASPSSLSRSNNNIMDARFLRNKYRSPKEH